MALFAWPSRSGRPSGCSCQLEGLWSRSCQEGGRSTTAGAGLGSGVRSAPVEAPRPRRHRGHGGLAGRSPRTDRRADLTETHRAYLARHEAVSPRLACRSGRRRLPAICARSTAENDPARLVMLRTLARLLLCVTLSRPGARFPAPRDQRITEGKCHFALHVRTPLRPGQQLSGRRTNAYAAPHRGEFSFAGDRGSRLINDGT